VIKQSDEQVLSPIECCVIDTSSKTLELAEQAASYWRCLRYNLTFDKTAVSKYSMLISGIVSAAVNGGTKLLKDLFFCTHFKDEAPNPTFARKLAEAIMDQIKVVHFAIQINNKVINENYRPLHENIISDFEKMKIEMEPQFGTVNLNENPSFGVLPLRENDDENSQCSENL
jgi:hypothetical protein